MPTQQPQSQEQLDPQAVNLAKAIRQTESGGDFSAKGKSGEYGAYQFTEPTWQADASAAGVNVPLAQATPEQQNEVAYKKIKSLKDQGLNVGQIASVWNSGKPDAYTDPAYKGTNAQGVQYDVPAYAQSVAQAYQTIKNGGQVGVDPANPSSIAAPQQGTAPQGAEVTTTQPNLGDRLAARLNDVSNIASQNAQGQINVGSAALQTVGAAAGAVGDVTDAALNLIPGFSQLEQGFGNIVGNLAGTAPGQAVVQAGMDFAKAHPEIAGDLGAALNIASVIPMFKGLSLLSGAAKDVASTALESRLSGIATKELTEASSKTITGRTLVDSATKRGLNPIATIIGKPGARFLPDVSVLSDGKAVYSTTDAYSNLKSSLGQDDTSLDEMLKAAHDDTGISLDQVRKETISMAKQELAGSPDFPKIVGKINSDFDGIKSSLGDRNWTDTKGLNDIKRMVRESVNFKSDNLDENSRYLIGQTMMKKVEATAEKNGVKGIRDLNKKMASKIEAMKVLKHLNGKAIKASKPQGIIRQAIAGGLTAGGEAAGNSVGIPFAGALIGRGASGLIHKAPGSALKALSRVGQSGGITRGIVGGLLRTASPALTQSVLQK